MMGRIFWKFLFAFWLAMLAVGLTLVAGSDLVRRMQHIPEQNAETDALGERVKQVSELLAREDIAGAQALLRHWRNQRQDPEVFVIDEAGAELLNRPLSPDDLAFARNADKQAEPFAQWLSTPDGDRYAVTTHVTRAMYMSYHTGIRLTWQWLVAIASLVGLFFSALLAWHWARPLRALRWALHNIAKGHLDTRVMPRMGKRRDELGRLGQDFDSMAQRLELLVDAQRRLLHDVSHELRSPLARLEAAIELAERRRGNAETEPEMARITREAQRLNMLVGELLLLARLENGIETIKRARVDVMELVVAIADDAQFEARSKGRDVVLQTEGGFVASVNAELLYRAFENVIRNAVKYTRPDTAVHVSAVATVGEMIVTVVDHGPGLPDDVLQAIFEPFRRFETDPEISGFGLGLAIAQRAMESHGGAIHVARNAEGGLTFTLTLTRAALVRKHQVLGRPLDAPRPWWGAWVAWTQRAGGNPP